ncbi:MAG: hypothetical protein Q4F81_05330 [Eubacteriales bacterium]|nr:hypothetical protein [Eubacteriales bacterium]
MILDGKTALSGAADGIELCMNTVIPALFPFFVLSAALLRGAAAFPYLEKVSSFLFGLPRGTGSLALPFFLGGYPVGAQSVYHAYESGLLQRPEAERLLAFCNNAGPAFVFGVVGQMFPKSWMPWALWGIHLSGAWLAARCVRGGNTAANFDTQPVKTKGSLMSGAVFTMGTVCGWIILFRVLIAFLDRWFLWILPQSVRVALVGILELSNGCCELIRISDIPTRFILCSGMLAAGGLCVTAQTISVTQGLSLHCCFLGKLIQILVSLVLSYSLMYHTVLPIPLLLLPLLCQISKKRSGNRMLSGV